MEQQLRSRRVRSHPRHGPGRPEDAPGADTLTVLLLLSALTVAVLVAVRGLSSFIELEASTATSGNSGNAKGCTACSPAG